MSVIVPNYNHTRYITDAIQSVLNQTYRSFEIIVVDDGSTDNSREVVADFGNQVRYIWQENQGLAGARNTGIRAAKGELIGLLDADDQWLPDFLATMVSLAAQNPGASVFYSCARGMSVDGRDLSRVFGGPVRPPHMVHQALLRANFLIPSAIVMRRSAVVAAGLFDQRLRSCEDWDLWLRLLPEHSFVGTSACLVRYRQHDSSLSANPAGMQQAVRAVIEKHFGRDDGQWASWPAEKRRAYGGVYRYHLLTSVRRQGDWQKGALYLRRALQADPTLAADLDLFYELASLGEPQGYRCTSQKQNLEDIAMHTTKMLIGTFSSPEGTELEPLRLQTYGTAYFALGLVAYNTGQLSQSRRFLLRALRFRPELRHNSLVVGNALKSFVGLSGLRLLRRVRGSLMNLAQGWKAVTYR